MGRGGMGGILRSGVAAAVAGLVLGTAGGVPASASPDDELIWEEGTVASVVDGDTLIASFDAGSGARGSTRVRTIGVQAPETSPAECGASQAKARLRGLLPVGDRVQTRSIDVRSFDDHSGGRIVRSLYAQDEEGNWYDTSRGTVSDGWLLWFPRSASSATKAEWAHNLEYRVLADDASTERRGLWSADLCGTSPYPGADLRVWAKYWGTEKVYVENRSATDVDLSGWTIRDSALNYRRLPAGTVVPAGQAREVYSGDLGLNNLPADNPAFEGDAVYLMDNAGPHRTGNLRAWFPYPCVPDRCRDPLVGSLAITDVRLVPPATRPPSPAGSVAAVASTDGSGNVTVTWAHAADPGGPGLRYRVAATTGPGAAAPSAAEVTGTSHTFAGLVLGQPYTFSVTAVSRGGSATPTPPTSPVAPAGPPGTPGAPVVAVRDAGTVAVSWSSPPTGGFDVLGYDVSALEDPTKGCSTTDGATSCLVGGLATGTPYSFVVRAINPVASSAASLPSSPVTPAAPLPVGSEPPGPPTDVVATASDGAAVVSWTPPGTDGGHQVTSYRVLASPGDSTCTAAGGTTSCRITGLDNETQYTATVVAGNAAGEGPPSAPSNPVTPFRSATARSSSTTPPPPVADPWIGGQHIDLRNTSDRPLRVGGYGLWDAQSSRYQNGGRIENRAAYLFPMDTRIAPGQTLRVQLTAEPPPVLPADPGGLTRLWSGRDGFVGATSDFVEVASLTGSQVACTATPGGSCRAARPVSAASPPVGVTARTTSRSVTVAWGAPISSGGTPITGYTATAFDSPAGGRAIRSCRTSGAGRSCTFPAGVGTRYYVEVVASNAQGPSGPSWRVLAAPRTVPSAPPRVAVSGTPGGVNVSWAPAAPNGAPVLRYTASAYTARTGGSPTGSCTTAGSTLTGCTIWGLPGGTTYFVDVTATNRAGVGSASGPRVAGRPGPGGALSTYSKGRVTVRWDPPAPGSTTVTGYTATLYSRSSGGSRLGGCTAPAGATQCTTQKMKKRSKYHIELTMRSAAGAFTIRPRIVTGPPRKASAPKVTGATPRGRKVEITWAPPRSAGYTYLTSYGARLYSKSRGGSVKARCSADASTLTCTTRSMKKGRYYAAVRVKNSKGWSAWSKRVKVVVR